MFYLAYYSFIVGSIIQIGYWSLLFSRLAFFKVKKVPVSPEKRPVSVVICAKNEAENLQKYLPKILSQNYPNFEVIVVNDVSTDATAQILLSISTEYSHLKIVTLTSAERAVKGKKYALTKGIEVAKYPILLLTDADCEPASEFWIDSMQAYISDEKSIGIAYGPMFKGKGWLNGLARIETINTAIQYFSFAIWGKPYMGVGRNLIYKKALFDKADGFNSHGHIASGDDDLFVSQIADARNVSIILNPETFMYSEAKTTLASYFRQKGRHLTTSSHYQLLHKALLSVYAWTLFALHFYFFILINLETNVNLVVFLYLIRLIIFWSVNFVIFKKLKVFDLWWVLPIWDIIYLIYLTGLFPSLLFRNTSKWT